jgi:hypothetical protein
MGQRYVTGRLYAIGVHPEHFPKCTYGNSLKLVPMVLSIKSTTVIVFQGALLCAYLYEKINPRKRRVRTLQNGFLIYGVVLT